MTSLSPPPIEALPGDLAIFLLSFLTGLDLLILSHASPTLYRGLLSSDSDVWAAHLWEAPLDVHQFQWVVDTRKSTRVQAARSSSDENVTPWYKAFIPSFVTSLWPGNNDPQKPVNYRKKLYFREESLRFKCTYDRLGSHGGVSFAIDLWFARARNERTGILLSMDFRHPAELHTPYFHDVIHVDEEGRLICSMVDNDTVVTSSLEEDRWYHLALSYQQDPGNAQGTPRLYLDGELMVCEQGPSTLHRIRSFETRLDPLGFGSVFQLYGCHVGGRGRAYRVPRLFVSSNFNGIMDDVRFWEGELSADQVQRLKSGRERGVSQEVECSWSLKQAIQVSFEGKLACVQCTRPRERTCVLIRPKIVVVCEGRLSNRIKRLQARQVPLSEA